MKSLIWENYEALCVSMAWEGYRIYTSIACGGCAPGGIGLDDFIGATEIAFVKAEREWTPDNGAFTTLLAWKIRGEIHTLTRTETHQRKIKHEASKEQLASFRDQAFKRPDTLSFWDELAEQGTDAVVMAQTALQPVDDAILALMKGNHALNYKRALRLFFHDQLGWSRPRVQRAMKAVAAVVSVQRPLKPNNAVAAAMEM